MIGCGQLPMVNVSKIIPIFNKSIRRTAMADTDASLKPDSSRHGAIVENLSPELGMALEKMGLTLDQARRLFAVIEVWLFDRGERPLHFPNPKPMHCIPQDSEFARLCEALNIPLEEARQTPMLRIANRLLVRQSFLTDCRFYEWRVSEYILSAAAVLNINPDYIKSGRGSVYLSREGLFCDMTSHKDFIPQKRPDSCQKPFCRKQCPAINALIRAYVEVGKNESLEQAIEVAQACNGPCFECDRVG